eukprot:5901633-Pleurochrysis_carterae.AAC.1
MSGAFGKRSSSRACQNVRRGSHGRRSREVWGDRPIALAYVDVPGKAAKALAHLKLAFPVEANVRESVSFRTTPARSRLRKPTTSLPPCSLTA